MTTQLYQDNSIMICFALPLLLSLLCDSLLGSFSKSISVACKGCLSWSRLYRDVYRSAECMGETCCIEMFMAQQNVRETCIMKTQFCFGKCICFR
jgi:hypothetical protein